MDIDGNLHSPDADQKGLRGWEVFASTDPSLGLPLIPTIEEEDAADLARSYRESQYNMIAIGKGKQEAITASLHAEVGFHDGYKAAKAKKYSEEDMWKAFNEGIMVERDSDWSGKKFKKLIQSLTPLPKKVEVEMEEFSEEDFLGQPTVGNLRPKTKDNYIVVKRWIYE